MRAEQTSDQSSAAVPPPGTVFSVTASMTIDDFTYTSATFTCGAAGASFLAQWLELAGTFAFEVVESPATMPNMISFRSTCPKPVTFTVFTNGALLDDVLVADSVTTATLALPSD